jgi:hypothetical protein
MSEHVQREAIADNEPPSKLLEEGEVLARVPVARRTFYDWRKKGLIPFIRIPGSRRILYHWPSVEMALLRLQRGGVI